MSWGSGARQRHLVGAVLPMASVGGMAQGLDDRGQDREELEGI